MRRREMLAGMALSGAVMTPARAQSQPYPNRSLIVPDVPTLHETVLPGFDIETWTGILAPAGTSQDRVALLNSEMNKILAAPAIRQRLFEIGVEPQPTSPAEFGRFIEAEVAKWGRLVSEASIEAA